MIVTNALVADKTVTSEALVTLSDTSADSNEYGAVTEWLRPEAAVHFPPRATLSFLTEKTNINQRRVI